MKVTEKETKAILWAIHGVFPHRFPLPMGKSDDEKERKSAMVKLWHSLLNDLPEGSALLATNLALRQAKHPPSPGEIRESALASNLAVVAGADAWGEVCKMIGKVGMYRSPAWSSPAIAESVDAIGGWVAICRSENTVADRSQFIKHFDGVQERARSQVMTGEAKTIAAAVEARRIGGTVVARLLGDGKS